MAKGMPGRAGEPEADLLRGCLVSRLNKRQLRRVSEGAQPFPWSVEGTAESSPVAFKGPPLGEADLSWKPQWSWPQPLEKALLAFQVDLFCGVGGHLKASAGGWVGKKPTLVLF